MRRKTQYKNPLRRKEIDMTRVEFFTAVANAQITDEVKAYAAEQATKLSTPTAKQVENAALKGDILKFLATKEDAVIGAEIAKEFGISTSKTTGLCGSMVKDGTLAKSKVATEDGERVGYSVVR